MTAPVNMLITLQRIVQEVNAARDLEQALGIIVGRVKQTINVDVCTIYLFEAASRQYVLMATDGLNPAAVGTVRLGADQGLVSVVGETQQPVNLDNAPDHPRYRFIAETGEARFHGFLGVPMIHHRKVMGVLVVRQKEKRRFDEEEVAFVLTIASQLAGAIAHAEASGEIQRLAENHLGMESRPVAGLPGAPGVVIGTAVVVYPPAELDVVPDRRIEDTEAEVRRFLAALDNARQDIATLQARMAGALTEEDHALFNAYLLMLSSDTLQQAAIERIRAGNWAPGALREVIRAHAEVFSAMDDPYLRERAEDVRDIGRRVLVHLQSEPRGTPAYHDKTILVGEEITVTMLADVPFEHLAGMVSTRGSVSSHVAILARSLGIPAVLGARDMPVALVDGRELALDGYRGRIYIAPSASVRDEYRRLEAEDEALSVELEALRDEPAETPDGIRIPLYANAGILSDITPSLCQWAEGIGLYRTEFPFMIRNRFPTEEEQRKIYREVLEAFAPQPVTVRTLDIGGDKLLSYFPIVEDNPFLGWRGVRVTLDHPEIFSVQIRAILRASEGLNNLRLLLPMVSQVAEVDQCLQLIKRIFRELVDGGTPLVMPEVGIMIEVPSTIFQLDELAPRVNFLSVGTNDLTQYLLAVDRNNPRVADLYDGLHPAVLRALTHVVLGARRYSRPVSVCGEMASDPAAVVLLLGMGITSLSGSAASLPRVKWVIRNFSIADARNILDKALLMEDAGAVRRYLDEKLAQAGLGSLVHARR